MEAKLLLFLALCVVTAVVWALALPLQPYSMIGSAVTAAGLAMVIFKK